MTTAGQRLASLSGAAGNAGQRLRAIGGGTGTAGALLVAFSSLPSASAAVHLLHDRVARAQIAAGPGGGLMRGRAGRRATPVITRRRDDEDAVFLLLLRR